MALDVRPTDQAGCFDLYELDEKIGAITYERDDEDGDVIECWAVEIWSLMGTGMVWSGDPESDEEALEIAHELYEEFVAERRELKRPLPGVRVINIPMGGQRRR
ncbi:hypothetical protein AB0F24_17105 [Streptomyces platensis]|uniref:hypothetical protein n=1 Tax=Streptomyces platensis TaxID=58346 RepID=UPI0033F50F40